MLLSGRRGREYHGVWRMGLYTGREEGMEGGCHGDEEVGGSGLCPVKRCGVEICPDAVGVSL